MALPYKHVLMYLLFDHLRMISKVYLLFDLFYRKWTWTRRVCVGSWRRCSDRRRSTSSSYSRRRRRRPLTKRSSTRASSPPRRRRGRGQGRLRGGVTSQEGTDSCVLCVFMSSRCLHVRRLWYG